MVAPIGPSGQPQSLTACRAIGKQSVDHVEAFGSLRGRVASSGQRPRSSAPKLDKALLLRPFPHRLPDGIDEGAFRARYRDDLVRHAGIAVFVGGAFYKIE